MSENDSSVRRFFWTKIGLRGQFVLVVLLIAIVPLIVVSFISYYYGVKALENTIGENLGQFAKEKLDRADQAIQRRLIEIERLNQSAISKAVALANGTSEIELPRRVVMLEVYYELEEDMRQLKSYVGPDSEIIITNIHRQILRTSSGGLPDFQPIDDEWWQAVHNNGFWHNQIGNIEYNSKKQQHYLPLAMPIRDNKNNVVGAIKATLALPELSTLVETDDDEIIKGMEIAFIDKSGRVISASKQIGLKFSEHIEMSDAAMSAIKAAAGIGGESYGYEMAGETDENTGETKVYGWARSQRWAKEPIVSELKADRNFENWTVLVSQPASVAYKGIQRLTKQILRFTLIACFVAIPIALIVSQRIVTPIMQVANAARAIGHGEFDQEIPVTSENEVGILAEEFNSMRRNLKNAVEKLTREEKKMTAIVNSLVEGLILVDPDRKILHINPTAKHLINIREDVIDQSLENVIKNEALIQALKEAKTRIDGENSKPPEVTIELKNKRIIFRVIAAPFVGENGDTLGTVYLFEDITREKEIDQMKSDFISLVSHELRTPLTSIIGYVSFILDGRSGAINEKQRNNLTRVHRQSKRLAALINDLLDISRIESGRVEMKFEPISILEITVVRLEELRPQAEEKSITLNFVAPDQLPTIFGDEERIGQVVINLIGNAIKFTPEKGRITMKLKDDGSIIHVEVIDNGPGIPIDERQKIFEKFYQHSDVHTRQQGGTGLGLSIAKSIVESHGGRLWIDDGDGGRGSNFQFVLPISNSAEKVI